MSNDPFADSTTEQRAEYRQQEARACLDALRKTMQTRAPPAPGTTWRHPKTSETYVIHSIRNTLATKPGWAVTVAYDRLSDGSQWARPLSEWPGELEEML